MAFRALEWPAKCASFEVRAVRAHADLGRCLVAARVQRRRRLIARTMASAACAGLDLDGDSDRTVAINLPDAQELQALQDTLDNSLSFNLDPMPPPVFSKAAPALVPAPVVAADSGMLEFDMGSLSLDLDAPITENPTLAKATVAAAPGVIEGPLETKFALAEEFRALGDSEGARSLANEVVAQADGALKLKAQAFLNALS